MEQAGYTLKDWLIEHPPADAAFQQSVAGIATRVRSGEEFLPAVRELLDELALVPRDELRERAIAQEPPPTAELRFDAYLAALAEHVAVGRGLAVPVWATKSERFLERFWFVSDVPGLRATAIAQSPAAFRRRGVFIAGNALERR